MMNEDARFPLAYEAPTWLKAVVVAAMALGFIIFLPGIAQSEGDLGRSPFNLLIGLVMLIYLLDSAVGILVRRLRIWPDRFEYRSEFGGYSGPKNNIRGYRTFSTRYSGQMLRLYLVAPAGRSFEIKDRRSSDPMLAGWVNELPNLSVVEAEAFNASLRENPAFGSNYSERDLTISRSKIIARVINIGGVGIALWQAFLPYFPIAAAIACCACVLGTMVVAALSCGRYAIMWDLQNPKIKLSGGMVPGIALAFRTSIDQCLLNKETLIVPAIALGCVLALVVVLIDGRVQVTIVGWTALLLAGLTFGGIASLDRYSDQAAPAVYRVVITGKHITHSSRGNYTHYKLDISPLGIPTLPDVLDTNPTFYDQAKLGDTLCVDVHPGALGFRWFDFGNCLPATTKAQT